LETPDVGEWIKEMTQFWHQRLDNFTEKGGDKKGIILEFIAQNERICTAFATAWSTIYLKKALQNNRFVRLFLDIADYYPF
jgi:hypothetical protein